jgi:hypothetical protein
VESVSEDLSMLILTNSNKISESIGNFSSEFDSVMSAKENIEDFWNI